VNRRLLLPPGWETEPFRVADALKAGIPRKRLEASDLVAPFSGVRSRPDEARLRAVVPLLTDGRAVTGPTAARLWDLPLPARLANDELIHVSSRAPAVAVRRPGVVGSRRTSGEVVLRNGIPTLEPLRVWVSLAPLLTEWDLVAVTDRLISGTMSERPLASREELDASIERSARARGVAALRRALIRSRDGAWSRPETLLRLLVLQAGFPEPALNRWTPIGDRRWARPDLSWPELRVAVEYDGAAHDDARRYAADSERHERLVDAGWTVVRVRARDLFGPPSALIARLSRRLSDAGACLPAVDFARFPRLVP
jgi:very-short-patch-repair endonuclease